MNNKLRHAEVGGSKERNQQWQGGWVKNGHFWRDVIMQWLLNRHIHTFIQRFIPVYTYHRHQSWGSRVATSRFWDGGCGI